jgi:hypothetical protein
MRSRSSAPLSVSGLGSHRRAFEREETGGDPLEPSTEVAVAAVSIVVADDDLAKPTASAAVQAYPPVALVVFTPGHRVGQVQAPVLTSDQPARR